MTDETTYPFERGPYLQVAVLCEQILIEQDGVKSAIRMIDRITHTVKGVNPPQIMETFNYEIKLLVRFKSGTARGPMRLTITLEKPSGDALTPGEQTLNFEGDDDRGIDFVSNMVLQIDSAGLYWIDIGLDGHRVTRIPLRVFYDPQIIRIPSPG